MRSGTTFEPDCSLKVSNKLASYPVCAGGAIATSEAESTDKIIILDYNMNENNETTLLGSRVVFNSAPTYVNTSGEFSMEQLSADGNRLDSDVLALRDPKIARYSDHEDDEVGDVLLDEDSESGGVLLDEVNFTIILPFSASMATVVVRETEGNTLTLSSNVSATVTSFCDTNPDDAECAAGSTTTTTAPATTTTTTSTSTSTTTIPTEITCNGCYNCSMVMTGDYDLVRLSQNIFSIGNPMDGDCIEFGANNIEFDCQDYMVQGDEQIDTVYGIRMEDNSGNTIRDCIVTGFQYGIHLSNSSGNSLIKNAAINNTEYGIYLSLSDSNTITNSTANDNSVDGIHLSGSNTNTLSSNRANNNAYYGIGLSSSSSNTLWENSLTGNYEGINLLTSDYNTLDTNTVNSNTYYGLYIDNSDYNYVYYNTLCSNPSSDIYLSSSSGNSGYENTCDTTGGWNDSDSGCTYACSAETTTTLPTETTCDSCSDCTAKLNGSYDPVFLAADINSSSTCITFGANATEFNCQGYTLDGGESNWMYGVEISEKSLNTVKNCVITNFYKGIYLYSAASNTLRNNSLSSNWKGIYMEASDYNTLDRNTAQSNTDYGLYLGNSDYNYIYYNTMCSNSMYDIYLDYSTGNSGYENTCDTPDGWNDSTSGCTYACAAVTTTTTTSTTTTTIPPGQVAVIRELPDTVAADAQLTVTLAVNVNDSDAPDSFGITETPPDGWTIVSTDPTGSLESNPGSIEWLFWVMGNPVEDQNVTYVLGVPSDANGTYSFSGTVDYGGDTTPSIYGDTSISIATGCTLPGDYDPCGEVTLSEVIDFITLWAADGATLANVIDLITAWATG